MVKARKERAQRGQQKASGKQTVWEFDDGHSYIRIFASQAALIRCLRDEYADDIEDYSDSDTDEELLEKAYGNGLCFSECEVED